MNCNINSSGLYDVNNQLIHIIEHSYIIKFKGGGCIFGPSTIITISSINNINATSTTILITWIINQQVQHYWSII